MKFVIKHEIKGRMRIHVSQYRMSYEQADTLLYFLHSNKYVTFAKVYERTGGRCDLLCRRPCRDNPHITAVFHEKWMFRQE